LTLVNKFKIIKILGKIEGVNCEIFLDTCASVNAITRSALKKFKITKQAIGKIEETIFQAYSNSSIESEIYELEVTIGTRTFKDHFRVIEKDDIFDILIGVDSLKKNRFDINLVNDTLYYIDNDYTSHKLADLFYDLNFNNTFAPLEEDEQKEEDKQKEENQQRSESLLLTITIQKEREISTDIKENKNEIINRIINELNNEDKIKARNLFTTYENVLALKTDDLGHSKLLPHRIVLVNGAKPIKQKAYRLSKAQIKALKNQLIKLINSNLIEPSYSPWSSPIVLVLKKMEIGGYVSIIVN